MAGRKHKEEEHENHERWLVSYADFITLLFAFFVVMYSVSSVNEGKYRVLSDALSSAFRDVPGQSVGAMVSINPQQQVMPNRQSLLNERERAKQLEKISLMARQIQQALAPLIKDGRVRITEGVLGLTVEINEKLLFASGDARLNAVAVGTLESIAQVLAPTNFPIIVEGHTDNTPINTAQFPSNWELSGTRASSVVRVFIGNGISPVRLTATGYAEQRPVADNATPEGRQRNRRVAIVIAYQKDERPQELPLAQMGIPSQGDPIR